MELFVILLVVLAVLYFWYASIVGKRNKALESLSSIDVQLKQRSDLIPNIVKIAQKFMEHEKSLLTEITALRAQVDQPYDKTNPQALKEHLASSQALGSKMGQIMINVENYPDIKSDQTMIQAMQTYNEVEAQIAAARRFYNSSVTSLNNSVQIFPGSMIAKMAGIAEMPFYEADELSKAPVNVDDFFKA